MSGTLDHGDWVRGCVYRFYRFAAYDCLAHPDGLSNRDMLVDKMVDSNTNRLLDRDVLVDYH